MIYQFTLTYSGTDTLVSEPKGWTDFKSEIRRDFRAHGAIYKYSGILSLGFVGSGRTVLETAYVNDGFAADVTLTVEQRANQYKTWEVAFVGKAIMSNREYDENFFEVDFEGSTFQQIVKNRLKTKIKLDSTIDLDGNTLSGSLTEYTNNWNTLRLKSDYSANYRAGGNSTESTNFTESALATGLGSDVVQYLIMNFDGVIDDELKAYNITLVDSLSVLVPGVGNSRQNLTCAISGDLTFTYSFHFQLDSTVELIDDAGLATNIKYELILRHEDGTGVLINQQILETDNQTGNSILNHDFGELTLSGVATETVTNGDVIYYYLKVTGDGTNNTTAPYGIQLDSIIDIFHDSTVLFSILKASETKSVTYSLLHDVIERALYIVSGENFRLNSNYLGLTDHGYAEDGCGGLTAVVHGSKLRGISNPINISLSDLLESVQAIWGLGWGFERNYNNDYVLRIEPMEHFYQDGEIIDLGTPDNKEKNSYKETVFDDLVFNKVEIGFDKFSNDEDYSNNIEDFLTVSEYSLPIKTIDGDYNKKSALIGSGRLIQATYEKTDLTKRWKYDDSDFIVALVRDATNFIPENNENFESVGGLDDPDTAYNIRFAPVYMFLNHSLLVNSVLTGLDTSEVIQNTSAEINKAFNATFNNYEVCTGTDLPRQQRRATGNISIANNYNGFRLFKPNLITGKYAMTNTQYNDLIDAMENINSDTTKNLGYVTLQDNDGTAKQVYITRAKWNVIKGITDIEGIERTSDYGI